MCEKLPPVSISSFLSCSWDFAQFQACWKRSEFHLPHTGSPTWFCCRIMPMWLIVRCERKPVSPELSERRHPPGKTAWCLSWWKGLTSPCQKHPDAPALQEAQHNTASFWNLAPSRTWVRPQVIIGGEGKPVALNARWPNSEKWESFYTHFVFWLLSEISECASECFLSHCTEHIYWSHFCWDCWNLEEASLWFEMFWEGTSLI